MDSDEAAAFNVAYATLLADVRRMAGEGTFALGQGNDAALSLHNCLQRAWRADRTIAKPSQKTNNDALRTIAFHAKSLADAVKELNAGLVPSLAYTNLDFQLRLWGGENFGEGEAGLLSKLIDIERAANAGVIERRGAPTKLGVQRAFDAGFAFYLKFGNVQPSEAPDGRFFEFMRRFWFAATGISADEGTDITYQIQQVRKRHRDEITARWPTTGTMKAS